MIDHAIAVFKTLFEKNPLLFVEKLVAVHCRKADFCFTHNNYDGFHFHLKKAEEISQQVLKSSQNGYEFLMADIHLRMAAFFIFRENFPMASEQADMALHYFEKCDFNDADTIIKHASLTLLKCRLTSNLDQKKELLLNVKSKLLPFLSNNSSALSIYTDVEEELQKL
jgi:hypothetical protein